MTKFLPILLIGCFKLPGDMEAIDTTVVPFNNPYVTADDVVIQGFNTELECPNGEKSRFFMVYKEDLTEAAPVAIVLHSGAFDYVMESGDGGPLSGPHYHAESRLEVGFSTSKVWETLGLQINDVDPAEKNLGTLPAALADRGVVQLIPGNCWGDLWHNEEGVQYNDLNRDGFTRNGRTFAWWMVRLLTEPDFATAQGIDLPVNIDMSQLYLVGLGDGGRGVAELLSHEGMPTVQAALVDSSPDDLSAYLNEEIDFEDEIEGISRIFGEEALGNIRDWSFTSDIPLPERLVYLWSDGDPQLPATAAAAGAAALSGRPGVWVRNPGIQDHVLSNSDNEIAREVVDYMMDGTRP
jgi:hypothetical protein